MPDSDSVLDEQNPILQRYARTLLRYERMMEISRKLSSTLELNALLEHIVNAAAELTNSEAASILLVNQRTGVLRFEAAVDVTGFSLYTVEVPIENSIAGWVVTNGESLLIDDVTNDPRFYKGVDEQSSFHTECILAVPMETRDRVIGCMQALNKKESGLFTEEDLNTMNTLAAQAAIAIENARLFEQSDLIAEMVHELRTPLAAIKATTHILQRKDHQIPEEKRDKMLTTVQVETERLTRMTSEFLNLARLESGRTRMNYSTVNLGDLLAHMVDAVSPQAADRGIAIDVEITPPDQPSVLGDYEKLKQVILNLLTNAIKYNREGGEVIARAVMEGDYILVSVQDTGMGISEQNLPYIFEKFYRVTDTEGYTQGTGLGLAIAKRIVEVHGGEIMVDSEVDVGTTFTFTIPHIQD